MSITKVAKRAGVSPSTVSRILNKHPRVAPDTIKAVRRAMNEIGYVPSENRPGPKPGSRSALSKKNVAFITFGSSSRGDTPGFEQLIRGVSDAVNNRGMNLSIFHHHDPANPPAQFRDQQMHGLLLHGAAPTPNVQAKLSGVPAVWLMANRHRPGWGDQVMPSHYDVGSKAAQYLHSRGHRLLAFLNMDRLHWAFRMYYHAFAAAAEQLGAATIKVERTADEGADYWFKYAPSLIETIADDFLALSPQPTGIMIADDIQTALIQPVLQRKGLHIGPGHAEIVSVNNEKPYLFGLNPWPAVVDIRASTIGACAVSQLLWRMENPNDAGPLMVLVPPELVPPPENS